MRAQVTNGTGYRSLSAWSDHPCDRRYPVDITVHFCGPTVKQLRRAWQDAVQRGQGRLIRQITALLQVSYGRGDPGLPGRPCRSSERLPTALLLARLQSD